MSLTEHSSSHNKNLPLAVSLINVLHWPDLCGVDSSDMRFAQQGLADFILLDSDVICGQILCAQRQA